MLIEACIQALLMRIYCLPKEHLPVYAVFAAMLYVTLYRKYARKRWLRPGIGVLLAGWFLAVLWITIFSRESGAYESSWIPLHAYWLAFSERNPELIRSCFMNVALFYPAGLLFAGLLPQGIRYRSRMLCTVICFGLFSLSIELCQHFFQLGTTEIDDVLHNTLGAVAGFAASHLDLEEPHRS
jgi:VanZ family protein